MVRHRRRGRAPRGRGDGRRRRPRHGVRPAEGQLSDPAGVVRPAVELALAVARAGLTADPTVPPPPALRPYLGFAKQTTRSLEAVARVVERDDEFRARVAAVADEADVGRAGWLWLVRPEGWREELDGLVATAAAREDEARDAREERSARKRLAAAEAASARAEAALAVRAAELDDLRPALAEEREARARAEARVAELERAVEELTVARSEAVRQLKRVEARLVERSTEANALRSRLRDVDPGAGEATGGGTAEAGGDRPAGPSSAGVGAEQATSAGAARGEASTSSRTRTEPPVPAAEADVTDVPGDDTSASTGNGAGTDPLAGRPAAGTASGPPAASTPDVPPAGPGPGSGLAPDLAGDMAAELARTAEGAAVLAEGLARLARRLGGATGPTDLTAGAGTGAGAPLAPTGRPAPGEATEPAPPAADGTAGRRMPLALPGGVFDDSPEAAAHLLRVPGIVLVVDGYNVSMTAWPELGAGDQRRRLVAALEDLAARTATPTEVVFDGAEVDAVWAASTGRRLVRVRFSSPDIEADDVVIDIVGRLPVATPVVVASSDKRVRTDARRSGANLLHARQLVSLLRR